VEALPVMVFVVILVVASLVIVGGIAALILLGSVIKDHEEKDR